MVFCLRRATAAQLAQLAADPDRVFAFLGCETPPPAQGLLSRLFGKKAEPVPEPVDEHDMEDEADLDKAWHAIHFLLTGSAKQTDGSLCFIFHDWPPIGTASRHEVGLGQAMMVAPAALARFATALAAVSNDELRARYDPAAMAAAKVYLGDALLRDGDAGWDYVEGNLDGLRDFVTSTAAIGSGAVVWLS